MDITFRQLQIFQSVVIAGSITKASQRIGLSQPSISQQLAKLEETLNTQLIVRNRTGLVSMTPAGEFWFKSSAAIIERMSATISEHEQRFRNANVVVRLGVTPVMRGSFTASAAQIAQQEQSFVKFELIYDANSVALLEQLRMHRINFAILAANVIAGETSSFAVADLFNDAVVWAVPAAITDAEIRHALTPDVNPETVNPVLRRYVEIDAAVPTRAGSDDWYRHHLPYAMPAFGAPNFAASAEFVTAGLATCHLPVSMYPNLSPQERDSMRLIRIDGLERKVVLVMRKHMLTHPAYSRIFHALTDHCRTDYLRQMSDVAITPLETVLEKGCPQVHRPVFAQPAQQAQRPRIPARRTAVENPMNSIGKSVST